MLTSGKGGKLRRRVFLAGFALALVGCSSPAVREAPSTTAPAPAVVLAPPPTLPLPPAIAPGEPTPQTGDPLYLCPGQLVNANPAISCWVNPDGQVRSIGLVRGVS